MMTKETSGKGNLKKKEKKKEERNKESGGPKLSRNPISFWRGFEMKLT